MSTDTKPYSRPPGEEFPGKIPECSTTWCEFKCCKFDLWNYIVMYPWELEKALAGGLKDDHLQVLEQDYLQPWWLKILCTKLCWPEDIKPLDCKMYPLWARSDGGLITWAKCPLPTASLVRHAVFARHSLQELIKENPALADFFDRVEMVGYKPLKLSLNLDRTSFNLAVRAGDDSYLNTVEENAYKNEASSSAVRDLISELWIELDEQRLLALKLL